MSEHGKDFKGEEVEILISFISGHYKSFKGVWKGDSVWSHFITSDGRMIHINKDEVEYIQSKKIKEEI